MLYQEIRDSLRINLLEFARTAFKMLPPMDNPSILDIGCGGGLLSEEFAKRGAKVVGIDISHEAIDWAMKYFSGNNISFLEADLVKEWPIQDKFDVVTCFETIEHTKFPEIFLEQIHKHL